MSVELTWIGHASFRIAGPLVVYIDPWKVPNPAGDGDLVIVSHGHHDHCSPDDVGRVGKPGAAVLASADAVEQIGRGRTALPGQQITPAGVTVQTAPAYNPGKKYHPRANNWFGVVVTLDGVRVYYAGDTDVIDEMDDLQDIDVALLPVGGTYTMDAAEAAEAASRIGPKLAIPYHWGDIVGGTGDAEAFADAAACEVHILQPGQKITIG